MNPIKVIYSILAAGFLFAVLLGVIGLNYQETATETAGAEAGESGETSASSGGEPPAFMNQCMTCHGTDLAGQGSVPGLKQLDLSKEEIVDIVKNGTNAGMPGGLVPGKEDQVAEYLLSIQE
ncbi:MAG: cytochrome c [Bacillaceae bacterium]|nr:cytochrome c [Bacillaceae bacterium]